MISKTKSETGDKMQNGTKSIVWGWERENEREREREIMHKYEWKNMRIKSRGKYPSLGLQHTRIQGAPKSMLDRSDLFLTLLTIYTDTDNKTVFVKNLIYPRCYFRYDSWICWINYLDFIICLLYYELSFKQTSCCPLLLKRSLRILT